MIKRNRVRDERERNVEDDRVLLVYHKQRMIEYHWSITSRG